MGESKSDKKKIKTIGIIAIILGVAYGILSIVAKKERPKSVYTKQQEEQKSNFRAIGKSKKSVYDNKVKPVLGKVLSFCGLVVLSPVYLVISLAIYIDDPGPVLFTQKRVGKNKEYFLCHKFRSMKMSTPHDVPTHLLENPEQYITRVGKFLRKYSLDELPQIWDIFIGNMCLIGPRPALWNQDDLVAERDKYGVNDIRPGLTGWAQINGRDELEIEEKAKLDGEYVEKESFLFDMKCFFMTIASVLKHDGVVEGGTGEMRQRVEYKRNEYHQVDILGKKILFFSPAFFGYENLIAEKMREMGAYVDMYDVRSVTSAADRALLKISPKIFERKSREYYRNIIVENKDKNYDYILVVKCDMTPGCILKKFRSVYPNAKLCLMLWDSIRNIPGITEKFKYFDSLHSFDPNDCKKYPELQFRPLFYADQFCKGLKTDGYRYDVSFAGTIHSDRYAIISQVKKIVGNHGLKGYWFMYLQSKFIYYFYKATKKEFRNTHLSMFSLEKKNSEEIAKIVDDSRIVLDMQHPKQTGLTIRTLEMVGMNKKLITTNSSIKEYDFYNPNNISIIDRNNVVIDMGFLKMPYEPLDKHIYKKYSIETWINEVLS